MYPVEMTEPMRAELAEMGVRELRSAPEVDEALKQPGTTLVFVNSICGCAAGSARPGLNAALQHAAKKPQQVLSVFAGVDTEATQQARAHFPEYRPSSPSAALLKDGEVVWYLHRHQIEGHGPEAVAEAFRQAFEANC